MHRARMQAMRATWKDTQTRLWQPVCCNSLVMLTSKQYGSYSALNRRGDQASA